MILCSDLNQSMLVSISELFFFFFPCFFAFSEWSCFVSLCTEASWTCFHGIVSNCSIFMSDDDGPEPESNNSATYYLTLQNSFFFHFKVLSSSYFLCFFCVLLDIVSKFMINSNT